MKNKDRKDINRRNFLKALGTASVTTTAAIYGCKPNNTITAEGGAIGEVPTDKMTYRINHNTGDKVSLLGYGCMRWPLRQKPDGNGEEIDQDAVNDLVDYAIAHGVNYFDVAPTYVRGWSEVATGIALKRHPRDKFFIATKLSTHREDPKLRTFAGSKALYEKSRENLQVEYIDYYLLHAIGLGGMKAVMERFYDNGMLDFLVKEKAVGRIRNLGWSFHGDIEAFDFLLSQQDEGKIHWDFVQIQLNYIDWLHASGWNTNAEYLLTELEKRNIPAVIMEPLLGGRLSRLSSEALKLLKEIRPEESAASWAFRYAGTPQNVLTVLSGMVYMEHLQENIRTYSPLDPITEKEYNSLDKVTEIMMNDEYVQCTECEYCMPCPYGVDIPGVFGHYNRIISAGKRLKSSKDESSKDARRAFLIGYDRNVPKLRQASHCIGCEICKPHCPQTIDIPNEMRRIDLYAEQLKQKIDF
ncbi:aldo/keto reductase [uncultured Dysgonomonas sp.]|uniref:Fe-S oxidoreductase n=1 Tax=uncultured Dysgonomonas sp. TaxID=206096 RepID=A0A212IVD9_9BACT|nr:aldo/keto reductase [uncultured Dysgonomonas sp.]SBV91154.1 Fe-S oxidoreductase [uncultured Dysgonomonas sp.]